MARYKPYNANQSMLVPITLAEHIYEGSLEEAIHLVVEEKLDLSVFDSFYNNDETGHPAIHPKVLIKVILLAYSRGIIGSRRIEKATRDNVIFLALAGGIQPDHSTIAAFISAMKNEIMNVFIQVLLICDQMDLLGGTHLSLDGCKLPSNASKEWSATFKKLKKKRGKLKEKLKTLLKEHVTIDLQDIDPLEIIKAKRARQIKRIDRQIKRIDKFLESEEPKEGKTKKEIQSNVTDNDSAKMPTGHGVIQGYNSQAVVDDKHQIILHPQAMGNGQDADNLKPMIEATKENLTAIGKPDDCMEDVKLTTDANYHTNENIEFCESENIDAYIPDVNYRNRDERFKDQERFRDGINKPPKKKNPSDKFTLEDFTYDKDNDVYICPQGHSLKLKTKHHVIHSKIYHTYRIKGQACINCNLREQCLKYDRVKRRFLCISVESLPESAKPPSPSQRMQVKVDSIIGRYIYSKRLGNIEPVFGNIRYNKRLDRFTYRTKVKVNAQRVLFCLIHNIEKIAHYGMA